MHKKAVLDTARRTQAIDQTYKSTSKWQNPNVQTNSHGPKKKGYIQMSMKFKHYLVSMAIYLYSDDIGKGREKLDAQTPIDFSYSNTTYEL